ncbi:MAG: hypothetical protein RhofKO_27520 [Rhodothermales bacterium]
MSEAILAPTLTHHIATADDPILVMVGRTIVDANAAALRLLGYADVATLRLQALADLSEPADLFSDPLLERRSGLLRHRSGTEVAAKVRGWPCAWEGQHAWAWVLEPTESSERYQAFFEAFVEQAPSMVALLDEQHTLHLCTVSFEHELGYDDDELIGQSLLHLIHPEDRPAVTTAHQQIWGTADETELRARLQHCNGEWMPMVVHLDGIEGENGQAAMYVHLEHLPHPHTPHVALARRVADVGQWTWDPATDQMEWSEQMYTLYHMEPSHAATLTTMLNRVYPDDRARLRNALERAVHEGEPFQFTHRTLRVGGKVGIVRVEGERAKDGAGQVVVHGLSRDITRIHQATRALRRSERRFKAIFNSTYQFIGLMDIEGTLLEANQAALTFGGITAEDVIGKPIWDAYWFTINEATQTRLQDAVAEAATGEMVRYNVEVKAAKGETAIVDFTIKPVFDAAGKVELLIPEGRDVTEEVRAKQRLKATEAHQRAVISSLAEGVISIDEEGVFTQCNEAAAALLGVEAKAILGQSLISEDGTALYEDGTVMPNAELPMLRVLRTGQPVIEETVGMHQPNGDIRWVVVSARPIVASRTEHIRGVVGSFHDVTERREQAALYQTVTGALAEGIIIFDNDGQIIDCNESGSTMLGLHRENLIGQMAYDERWGAVHEDGTPVRLEEFPAMEALRTGNPVQDRIIGIRRRGEIAWLSVNVRPLYVGLLKQAHGAVASIRDITLDRAAAAELQSSRAQLSDLARRLQSAQEHERARLSREVHDVLGQALTALRIDLTWMRDNVYEAHENFEARVTEAVRQAQETIETARQISRTLRPGILDHFGIGPAIDWQATQFEERTGITCTFEDDTDFMLDEMDRTLATALFRILQEAQTNILKHANATQVEIHLALTDEALTMTVKDNGRGIKDAEKLKRNSLGLLNMRERVYPWGGEVQITGKRKEGTTVCVVIPRDRIDGIEE